MKMEMIKHIDLKLNRAKQQSISVTNEINEWCSKTKLQMKCELLPERLGYRIVVGEFDFASLLDDWSLVIGEIMHNLRSILDNLAFSLARLKQDPPQNPKQIYFPIFQDETEFIRTAKKKIYDQLSVSAAEMVEKFQPFQRQNPMVEGEPHTDPLVFLHWFNNMDKHQTPRMALMIPNGEISQLATIEFYSEEDSVQNGPPQVEIFGYPLKPGANLLIHKTNKPIKKVSGMFSYSATVSVESTIGFQMVDPLLRNITSYVELVVDHFRHHFKD